MKLFTLQEANDLLPAISLKLSSIKKLYRQLDELRPDARNAAGASIFGGGMVGGTRYVDTLYRIGKLTTEIHNIGVEIKDPTQGLIDFPSMRGDRMILLCWKLGEEEEIDWWHEPDDGFAGRQRL